MAVWVWRNQGGLVPAVIMVKSYLRGAWCCWLAVGLRTELKVFPERWWLVYARHGEWIPPLWFFSHVETKSLEHVFCFAGLNDQVVSIMVVELQCLQHRFWEAQSLDSM
jgi:hypothetical protein